MRCIFLDFDGVLNSRDFINGPLYRRDLPHAGNEHEALDLATIVRLNRVIEATGAKVVVSSTWRFGASPQRLEEILCRRGFAGDVIDSTGEVVDGCRGDEIELWLSEHPDVEKFVVVDDVSDHSDIMRDHLVRTDFKDGMRDEHADEMIRRLL